MQPTIHRHSFSRTGARWALGSLLGLGALFAQTASASALGDAIRQLGASDGLQRSVTLKELGIVDPVVLAGTATQDFYLPVPRGLPLGDASIAFDGRYLKGEPGTSTVVISLNGTPAVSQTVPDGEGTLQRNLPVAQPARASDFVRLGVNWRNRNNSQQRCDENHSLANSLTISPQTRLSYRVDPRDVRTIEDVWNTLPVRTTVLVSGRQLEQASFDSAWRIGASLQRNNRRMQVRALPAVGEVIDLRGLEVPAALAGVPAFAALRGAEPQHKLASDAELGALLMLGAAQVSGDIVVADKALQQRLTAAFAALQAQLATDPDAGQALQQWRARRAPLASEALASQQLRALPMGRQMVLAVASDAGARVAGLQEAALQRLLVSDNVTVAAAQPPQWDEAKGIRLSSLGGSPDSFDVLSRGEWTMNFPLSAVASQGRMPGEITLYVAAGHAPRGHAVLERHAAVGPPAGRQRPARAPARPRARLRAGHQQHLARVGAAPALLGRLQRDSPALSRQRAAGHQLCDARQGRAQRQLHRPAAPAGRQVAAAGACQLPVGRAGRAGAHGQPGSS